MSRIIPRKPRLDLFREQRALRAAREERHGGSNKQHTFTYPLRNWTQVSMTVRFPHNKPFCRRRNSTNSVQVHVHSTENASRPCFVYIRTRSLPIDRRVAIEAKLSSSNSPATNYLRAHVKMQLFCGIP